MQAEGIQISRIGVSIRRGHSGNRAIYAGKSQSTKKFQYQKNTETYDPAIPLLGIHTEETRTERDTCTPMFITALFIIARTWKQPRCPSTDEWIRKLWYIYTVEYYSAIKKNAFESVLMKWMNLESIIQSEVSQKDKHQYSILTHIYGIQKDGNDNPICKTEKETRMYRTDFWTLWEKARVG